MHSVATAIESCKRVGSRMCAKNEELLMWSSSRHTESSATIFAAVASSDIDLLPRKRSALKVGGGGGGGEFERMRSLIPESTSGVPASEANSKVMLSEMKESEYSSGAEVERARGFRSPPPSAVASYSDEARLSSIMTMGENRKGSSSIVLSSEFLRPPVKLLREFEVDKGPKMNVAQERGRSLVAIREIRECLTISGNSNIVSKICSLSAAAVNCKAEAVASGEPRE